MKKEGKKARISIRTTVGLENKLKTLAEQQGTDLSKIIVKLLEDAVKEK